MKNLLNKSKTWRAFLKLPKNHKWFLIVALLACLPLLLASGPVAAAVGTGSLTLGWTQIIVTLITVLLGGGGIFALVKYVMEFKLGKYKENNRVEETKVDAAAELRDEYRDMLKELRAEMNILRERIAILEKYISDNNLPLPKMEDD